MFLSRAILTLTEIITAIRIIFGRHQEPNPYTTHGRR